MLNSDERNKLRTVNSDLGRKNRKKAAIYRSPGNLQEGQARIDPELLDGLRIPLVNRFSVNVIRPRDLLELRFTFVNIIYEKKPEAEFAVLRRWKASKTAYIIAQFPQQSIQEKAFFETHPGLVNADDPGAENPTAGTPPIPARISGRSRVVLKMPKDAEPIPYTVEGLLDILGKYPMAVARNARPPESSNFRIKEKGFKEKLQPEYSKELFEAGIGRSTTRAMALRSDLAIANAQKVWRENHLNPAYSDIKVVKDIAKEKFKISSWIADIFHALELMLIRPRPEPPNEFETAIEAPYRLILSPNTYGAWKHANDEVLAVHRSSYIAFPGGIHHYLPIESIVKLELDGIAKEIRVVKTWDDPSAAEKLTAIKKTDTMRMLETAAMFANVPFDPGAYLPMFEDIDWVELWHTRLATRQSSGGVSEAANAKRTMRAIWARDARFLNDSEDFNNEDLMPQPYPDTPLSPDDQYRTALDSLDRLNIVHLSSNYQLKAGEPAKTYAPLPIDVDRMMLSTLGSWLNVRGAWPIQPPHLAVEEWRHRSTMARDHYVRVVYKGYLFPFGHRASLVKVTERKFHNALPGNPAYQRQRMFIVVREPERAYGGTGILDGQKQYDLQFPFVNVRITTLVTPMLAPPEQSDIGYKSRQLFRPRDGATTKDFRFHVIAKDLDGKEIEFSTPMTFVGKEIMDLNSATCITLLDQTQTDFTEGTSAAAPANLEGQSVTYASSKKLGDTSLNTSQIWFGGWVPDDTQFTKLKQAVGATDIARFYPRIEKASARIPAIQHLAGNNTLTNFQYPDAYLKHGFSDSPGHNKGEVFAELIDDTAKLSFSDQGQRSGALLTPDLAINGLSRVLGPIGGAKGDLDSIVGGSFDPEKFFAGMSPMLFGAIPLWELVGPIVDSFAGSDAVPKFISQTLSPIEGMLSDLNRIYEQLDSWGGASAGDLMNSLTSAITSITDILGSLPNPIPEAKWTALTTALEDINTHIMDVIAALNDPAVSASVRITLEAPLQDLKQSLTDADQIVQTILKPAITLFTEMRICLDWKPKLNDWPSGGGGIGAIFDTRGGQACLHLHVSMCAMSTTNGIPAMNVSCGLEKFNLNLIGEGTAASFMKLKFDKIEFAYSSGSKPDVNVEFDGIEFVGVLSFVEALKSLIPLDGFSDPPGLEVTAEGITGNLSLALPNLTLGVFSLSNMSLSAGFSVPFIGDPLSVWFAFCTRDNPFCLTVSMFGGGGFFSITLQPNGLKCLEASFEFGASISVDFGVASGGIYAMAGIYFKMEAVNGELAASLTGYFRMGGHVSVLGIISISIELYLSLTYEFSSGKCTGRAELTLEVEVLFFSVSVSVVAERKFAGSNGDPSFAELMAPYYDPLDGSPVDPWEVYCEAFA